MNKWTVHVTDFGKIKSAKVETAPITFFVGDNNSGKSYLMTLIYGLLNIQLYFSHYEFDEESEVYRECCGTLDSILEGDFTDEDGCYTLNEQEIGFFEQLLNSMLKKNKEKFLLELFNRETTFGEIRLEFDMQQAYRLEADTVYDREAREEKVLIHGFDSDDGGRIAYGASQKKMKKEDLHKFFLSYIMEYMIKMDFESRGEDRTVYFPTARTGFLLTYKTLVGSALRDKFNVKETEKNLLTRPNSDFLTSLSEISTEKKQIGHERLVSFIEKNMIHGKISMSDMPTQDIMYAPDGVGQMLPMYVSSAVVTELTPLLLFLNYMKIGTVLMEEPEISLHPELQREMARLLIRMKNEGIPVFATTHSDIVIQHINNMIKLGEISNQDTMIKELGYDQRDLIDRKEVAVYQFEVTEDQRSTVTKLSCGDYGFEAMTFYNTLKRMNEEIDRIEGAGE